MDIPGITNQQKPQSEKPKEQSSGLFSSGHDKKAQPPNTDILGLKDEINSIGRRMRVIEEQATNLRRKTQVMEQNMLRYNKKTTTDVKIINDEINDLKQMINDIDNKLLLIIKELKLCAKKEDVNYLQKYVTMWEPIKFVTRDEVERIIEDMLQDREESN